MFRKLKIRIEQKNLFGVVDCRHAKVISIRKHILGGTVKKAFLDANQLFNGPIKLSIP